MAVYTFSFDSKYAGHTATVTDATGAEVTGSPITLDADGDGSLNLSTGNYRAQVSNAEGPWGDGYSVVDGVFDIEASIAAADGGLDLSSTPNVFACTSTMTIDPVAFSTEVSFDTVPTGYTTGTDIDLPAGLYVVNIEVDFAEPAEQRVVTYYLAGSLNNTDSHGPFVITPGTVTNTGWLLFDTVIFNRVAGNPVKFALIQSVDSGVVSPADLAVDYVGVTFNKIA